jgi:hypothetical protein
VEVFMRLLAYVLVAILAVPTSSVLASDASDEWRLARASAADRATNVEPGPIAKAGMVEVSRLVRETRPSRRTSARRQSQLPPSRSWIGRHPVIFGALVGFAGGYLIGYLPGDDAVFDDFTAGFNGYVMGGAGAGIGAITGAIVGAIRK